MGLVCQILFFGTLGQIEIWLTKLDDNQLIKEDLKDFVKASLYGSYYQVAMKDNIDVYRAKDLEDIIFEPTSLRRMSYRILIRVTKIF